MKHFQYRIEYALFRLIFALFRALPLDAASALGGALGRIIGPFFSAHQTAIENLRQAFPEKTEAERRRILSGMWDNLGRVAAEYPHLPGNGLTSRVHVRGREYLPTSGQPALFFSGHFGNWELDAPMAFEAGVPLALIYRHINNPLVDAYIAKLRLSHASRLIAKGKGGAISLVRALKGGQSIAMLIDQKMNDGMAIPFFGRDAMTATAIAELALSYDRPILPARIVRTQGAHFEGDVFPPMEYEKTGDKEKDIRAIMTAINRMLEGWIREHPEQWFWVHRRWG